MIDRKSEPRPETENVDFDVVCGQLVDTTATEHKAKYRGKTYSFCCANCKDAFESRPHSYAHSYAYGPFH